MSTPEEPAAGEVVLPAGGDLDAAIELFTRELGFRLESIFPADAPTVAVLAGHGLRVRLQTGAGVSAGLRLPSDGPSRITAPGGTPIELVDRSPALHVPPLRASWSVTRLGGATDWHVGRAGMRYRDLIPDRQGGRFVASHIHVPDAGPVPDYVHYHEVRFQVIYCYRGWVRVVYEDQGPPFVLRAGDCVLQPPGIRHRVLECGPDLEVIELGCPAEHATRVDHDLSLPTAEERPDREFGGQRFVRHVAQGATWRACPRRVGFEARRAGLAEATGGLAELRVLRPVAEAPVRAAGALRHDAELWFAFTLRGSAALQRDGESTPLSAGDSCVVPAGASFGLTATSTDLELLEISLPAAPALAAHRPSPRD